MALPKSLIVDASILFSFFKSDSIRRYVIEELLNAGCELISPDFVLKEISDKKGRIIKFSELDESEFDFLFSLLKKSVKTFEKAGYSKFLSEANKISPHLKGTEDDPYFALSLSLNKTPIWSDEDAFREQSEIKIFTTEDLMKELRLL